MFDRSTLGQLFRATASATLLLVHSFVTQAENQDIPASIPRHPLEIRALTDPGGVRRELPSLIETAKAEKNFREVALLKLAESNACRVVADWQCQSSAADDARTAAQMANIPELQARGFILESRGRMAMQDFSRAAQLLSAAEKLLVQHPFSYLSADVYLAYSSLSYAVGKHTLAAEYAERGLAALGSEPSLLIRIRLLRNQARAMAQLGNTAGAQVVLKNAISLVATVEDPKLSAELQLESARVARLTGDIESQVASGLSILALAKQLSNSQLDGLAHEVLGLAALNRADSKTAERELRLAYSSFMTLKLERDERRVLRALIRSVLASASPAADLKALVARMIALETAVETDDRNMAADDFEARLKFAQQELDVQRLETSAALAAQRAIALEAQQRFTLIVALLSLGLLLVFGILIVLQRRFNQRLKKVVAQVQESEFRYRMLAENSRDLVVRMRLDGQRLYVSPAIKDLLGLDPQEFSQPRWDLVHPDDRDTLISSLRQLGEAGGSATIAYRAQHANGNYIWIEALARLVPGEGVNPPEIVYSGRDITTRVLTQEALSQSEHSMRAITDNIPAMIARVDSEQRYTFVNAFIGRLFGVAPETLIGKTIREVRGEKIYSELEPHIHAALRGETVSYEGFAELDGRPYHYQSNFVPDRDASGTVQGFFALTFDITELKNAQAKLDRLARMDALSGVANRRYFEEHIADALARSHRQRTALALLCVDIDHFKTINDKHGHPVGDAVIVAFAEKLVASVREDDLVARLGGDEFALLIESPGPESGKNIAEKLLVALQQPFIVDGLELTASASIGVAYSPRPSTAKALMDLADKALYEAKRAGRNTYRSVEET